MSQPLRVAFAMINCNRRDGSARAVNEVAERLVAKGHEVHLYARKVEDLDLRKVHWHRVPGPGWPEVADFWSYHVAVNRRLNDRLSLDASSPFYSTLNPYLSTSYDIIHSVGCNTLRANVITIQNVQPAKTEVMRRLGRTESVSLPRRVTRALYLKVTTHAERKLYTINRQPHTAHRSPNPRPLFLPVSRGVESELRAHYDIGDAPVQIIPNAADTSVFKPVSLEDRYHWRTANGFQLHDFICTFSGGEWARKGLDLAIRALALIRVPKVKLFVAGDDPDRDRYRRLTSDLRISDRVIFGGFQKDMAIAMAASDLFLFPSWYEAFSLATIEAAACGLPILATKINGTEDFIRSRETGEFIEHDPGQIASLLRRLSSDLQTCRAMGQAARRLVEENYTWDRVADLTEESYYIACGQEGA